MMGREMSCAPFPFCPHLSASNGHLNGHQQTQDRLLPKQVNTLTNYYILPDF